MNYEIILSQIVMYDYDLEERRMNSSIRDWRKALRTPATYRVGNAVTLQPRFIFLVGMVAVFLLILFYCNWTNGQTHTIQKWSSITRPYNATYPLTTPLVSGDVVTFRIGIVTDLDTNSKITSQPNTFQSYFKKGMLHYDSVKKHVTVVWDSQPATVLTSTYGHKGRGMELSELIVYDGRLLTFDDRSGIVFEILNNKMMPWVILIDGGGHVEKGFKTEWASVKDEILYVGSMGKEWTTAAGDFQSYDPMWIKIINMHGEVQHQTWVNQYKAIRSAIKIQWPGYMIHESGVWSNVHHKWYFLPRRCSVAPYNETRDETMGCNYLITADAAFLHVEAMEITKRQPKHGFSSFKFIPGSNDEAIVALKTTEFEGKTATYISAFRTDGTVLLHDTFVENLKYEGLEFI